MKEWTREEIEDKIINDQKWLERGILAIFEKQTAYEKDAEFSQENNKVGFNKPDARKLSYYAKWIKSGRHLSGHHLENAKKKMVKYSGQLKKIANGKI